MLSMSLAIKCITNVHYSVQPRHLHYTDVMLLLCDVLFGLGLGLGLGLACHGIGLSLELLTFESKPESNMFHRYVLTAELLRAMYCNNMNSVLHLISTET